MKPTVKWMYATFSKCNMKYFGGRLPVPEMRIDPSCNTSEGEAYGMYILNATYKENTRLIENIKGNGIIALSGKYDRSENEWTATMLHEMIHEYIFLVIKIYPKDQHGNLFKRLAEPITEDGFDVFSSESTNGNNNSAAGAVATGAAAGAEAGAANGSAWQNNQQGWQNILCLIYKPNGTDYKYWCTICDINEISNFYYAASRINGVSNIAFYKCASRGIQLLKVDYRKLNGFGGMSISEVSQKMANWFRENVNVFDFSKMERYNG